VSNYPQDYSNILQSSEFREELAAQQTFMARVYGWMTIGLLITALTALIVSETGANLTMMRSPGLFITMLLVQIGVAMAMTWAINRIPAIAAAACFLVYSITTGLFFSILFLVYTSASIYSVFFITAGMFGAMSFIGYVTKKDLSSLGMILGMALIGLIIASVVNLFFWNSMLYLLISYAGVVIFTALTAYDTQKIKQGYAAGGSGTDTNKKIAIYGAFSLYLDFINLFLYLLRILGSRRD